MIILEGPDNAGKTTLGKHLVAELGLELIHGGDAPKDLAECWTRIDKIMDHPNPAIFDRVIQISEQIYGNVFRNTTFFDCHKEISRLRRKHYPLIIYCRPDISKLLHLEEKDFRADEEKSHVKKVKENQQRIVNHYDDLFQHYIHIRYNYTKHNISDLTQLTKLCKKYLKGKHN